MDSAAAASAGVSGDNNNWTALVRPSAAAAATAAAAAAAASVGVSGDSNKLDCSVETEMRRVFVGVVATRRFDGCVLLLSIPSIEVTLNDHAIFVNGKTRRLAMLGCRE